MTLKLPVSFFGNNSVYRCTEILNSIQVFSSSTKEEKNGIENKLKDNNSLFIHYHKQHLVGFFFSNFLLNYFEQNFYFKINSGGLNFGALN